MAQFTAQQWDQFLNQYPQAHLLQTSEWGQFKQAYGWRPIYISEENCGAMVLFRQLPLGHSIAYIPKGPVGIEWNGLWPEVQQICREQGAIALQVEPDYWEEQKVKFEPWLDGFQEMNNSIQPRRTSLVSLEGTPQEWLARMKQKTRYNIRLAEKKGIQIDSSEDLDTFNRLMSVTGERDAFGIHQAGYYREVFASFHPSRSCNLFLARFEDQPLAAIMVFKRGTRAWYFYGASNEHERNRMPTYLLQWEAMRWASEQGCSQYDLWGVPDYPEEELEANFAGRSDDLWGVYRFKRGFGGELKRTAGLYIKVLQPTLYQAFQAVLKLRKYNLA